MAGEGFFSCAALFGPLFPVDLLKLNGLAVNLKYAFYLVIKMVERLAVFI